MLRYLLLICALLTLVACSARDEDYYRKNPQALQLAIKNCPEQAPAGLSCEQLTAIAHRINQLAYQLQISPQNFGRKILELQQTLAKQQAELEKNPEQSEIKAIIEENKQQLSERLAIVKWLESPES
ncbi:MULTISPECIES: hypothetical protein [unclassified Legionella]|uniref:hypothetical protein n=1 Tax=unclassified Legionella TaxID=2622702 RepID=UPI001055A90A|nr:MULTISPECIES: hypothetical protein [unclassified Legionella]MDI9818285.1 hypothetical protein [Legionella sp. PL877]